MQLLGSLRRNIPLLEWIRGEMMGILFVMAAPRGNERNSHAAFVVSSLFVT